MHDIAPAPAARHGRTLPIARLATLALVLALAACRGQGGDGKDGDGKADADKAPEAVPVEIVRAARRAIAASYNGTAALEARGEAQVVSKTSGIALQVLVDVGEQVRAGQVLVRIDRDRATLQVAQADSQVRKLEANYRRATQLAEQKMVSANDVDQLRQQRNVGARQQLFDFRSQLEHARRSRRTDTAAAASHHAITFHRGDLRPDAARAEPQRRRHVVHGEGSALKQADDAAAAGVE